MGKRLIIKGADFSANGIPYVTYTWFTNFNMSQPEVQFQTGAFYIPASEISAFNLSGKTVKAIRFYAMTTGTIEIFPYENSVDGTHQVFQITQPGVNIINLETPIPLSSTQRLGIKTPDGVYGYNRNVASDTTKGWKFSDTTNVRIPVDFGTYTVQ